LTWSEGAQPASGVLNVGDRIESILSHIDTTINLHDVYYAHRAGKLEAIWPVAARGKVQWKESILF
jgi:D-serine deaminase-like pyridoxal phosphate-dependent protein